MAHRHSATARLGLGIIVLALLTLVVLLAARALDSALLGIVAAGLLVVTGTALGGALRHQTVPVRVRVRR